MSNFKVGELVVSSKPYAYALKNEFRGRFCDYCFKENNDLKRCSQCKFVYFCDKNCQINAWKDHKIECKLIKKAGTKKPTPSLRLMAQIIFKIKKYGEEAPYEEVDGRKISFSTLMSHAEDIKKDLTRCQLMTAMLVTLKEYIGAENIPPPDEFTKIFGKMCINSFSICREMSPIGSGLYLGASVFDHSCDPDAVVIFDGAELNVRMIKSLPHRDISKVYVSYIEEIQLTEDRQKMLKEQYYFTCKCSCCLSPETDILKSKLLDDSPETKELAIKCQQDLKEIEEMVKDKNDSAAIKDACTELLKVEKKIMAVSNLCMHKTLEIVFDMCINLNAWEESLHFNDRIEKNLRLYFGKYHPYLGLFLFKVGKIVNFLGSPKVALCPLLEAGYILKITHGEHHPLTQDIKAVLQETKLATNYSENIIKIFDSYDEKRREKEGI